MQKTILAILAMAIATLLIHARQVNAKNYPWCEQCMAASRWCDRNPMYQAPAGQPQSRRK
jgi:hypothetical protein